MLGRAEGLPGCDKQRLSSDAHPVVHHPYGAQQPEIRVVELKLGYLPSQGNIHHECHRVAEQRYPCSYQKAKGVPDRRRGAKSYLSGDQGCVKKMEYADPKLAAGVIIEFGDRLSDHL